jgi:rfaE bifunctional protein nucleotidyltransferase chain/domain
MALIYTFSDLQGAVDAWRAESLVVGFTCGAFDLLHAGHADYLQQARKRCDRLIVAVNSDESVRAYKDPLRPIIHQQHRMNLVAALRCVDAVTLMEEKRPVSLITQIRPDVYFKGGDYATGQLRSAPLVESYGGRTELIPVEHAISSSAIIQRIQEISLYAAPEKTESACGGPMVILDRDGTLIENVHFLNEPARVKLLPGVAEGLLRLQKHGFRLVVVTNQQGIGLGYVEYDDFVAVNSAMLRQLGAHGVAVSRFYYCPHTVADHCECRKPGAKLVERALRDFSVPREDCFFIGDTDTDMAAAAKAGVTGILLAENASAKSASAPGFEDAVNLILELSQGKRDDTSHFA